ncbi:MAG: diaminopimelate epimerase [Acidobacteria bacterium]|nr:diaminopimelate epimerase [Acidobacteriota bacterium]
MHPLPFTKATACGNDFLVAELPENADLPGLSRAICDRNNGIGADGIEFVSPAVGADLRARLFNADGSEAEISGNGSRCVAAWHCLRNNLGPGSTVTLLTLAGVKPCLLRARDGMRFEFEMRMGEPAPGNAFALKLAFGEVTGIPVSIGNPHFVVFVDDFMPGWQAEAAEIGCHHDFKHGINVELARVVAPDEVEIRIFERGVGETRSSGTGSCAAAVAAISTGRANPTVLVRTPGGVQVVRWEGGELTLAGPARILAGGEFYAD